MRRILIGQGVVLVVVNLWLLFTFFTKPFPATQMYQELDVKLSAMEQGAIEYGFILPVVGMAVGIAGIVLASRPSPNVGLISTGLFSMVVLDMIATGLRLSYALDPLFRLIRNINDTLTK